MQLFLKIISRTANSVVWSGSALFAYAILTDTLVYEILGHVTFFLFLLKSTLQPLYNTVHYDTVLDITRFKDGSQKCMDYIEK